MPPRIVLKRDSCIPCGTPECEAVVRIYNDVTLSRITDFKCAFCLALPGYSYCRLCRCMCKPTLGLCHVCL